MPQSEITDLIRKVRDGDAAAAQEMVERYKPLLQREIRFLMRGPQIRTYFDSEDVCQSIFANFFLRLSLGQYDLQENRDLVGLLKKMVRSKVASRYRYHYAQKRDARKLQHDLPAVAADKSPRPDQVSIVKDLLEISLKRLSPDMAVVARQRMEGETWERIAQDRPESADALRCKFDREVAGIAREIGLEE